MLEVNGVIPALVTPFNNEGEINEIALKKLVDYTIQNGCRGLFCLGSNGEFFSLSKEEKIRVANVVVEAARGRVPVYAGTGTNSAQETIELTNQMESIGVDAVSIITHYFVKLSEKELINYYNQIADNVNVPIVLYNIPNLTGNSLSINAVKEISKRENVVAIKDSSGNFDNIIQLTELVDDGFSVLVGTDSLILSGLIAGAQGAIAATANLLPKVVSEIYNEFLKGDLKAAGESQNKLKRIRSAFKLATMPSVLKSSLNHAGIEVGTPRLPTAPVTKEISRQVEDIVMEYKKQGDIII